MKYLIYFCTYVVILFTSACSSGTDEDIKHEISTEAIVEGESTTVPVVVKFRGRDTDRSCFSKYKQDFTCKKFQDFDGTYKEVYFGENFSDCDYTVSYQARDFSQYSEGLIECS